VICSWACAESRKSQVELLTTTSPGKQVPATHSVREIERLADAALAKLESTFDAMYSSIGHRRSRPRGCSMRSC
jgi:hypothetical protein